MWLRVRSFSALNVSLGIRVLKNQCYPYIPTNTKRSHRRYLVLSFCMAFTKCCWKLTFLWKINCLLSDEHYPISLTITLWLLVFLLDWYLHQIVICKHKNRFVDNENDGNDDNNDDDNNDHDDEDDDDITDLCTSSL